MSKPCKSSLGMELGEKMEKLEITRATKRKTDTADDNPYIPPSKLRMLREAIMDKSSKEYQRMAWEALEKSIRGSVNKAHTFSAWYIAKNLCIQNNIVRGRGPLCYFLLRAQAASPAFTNVYAAFVTTINSKFPVIGELLSKRCILQFRKNYRNGCKAACIIRTKFIAHLVNQRVLHEDIAFEILKLLLDNPTDNSIEIATSFLKECGNKLTDLRPESVDHIFDTLRDILLNNEVNERAQHMIRVIFQIRKSKFKDYPAVSRELFVLEKENSVIHQVSLDQPLDPQPELNLFIFDPQYLESEKNYQSKISDILRGDDQNDRSASDDACDWSISYECDEEEDQVMSNKKRTNYYLTSFHKTIFLMIQWSHDYDECADNLLKMQIQPGCEMAFCRTLFACATQLRAYERPYCFLAQSFCKRSRECRESFNLIFISNYKCSTGLGMRYLKSIVKFFALLLYDDSLPWTILSTVRLNGSHVTSSRITFVQELLNELVVYLGSDELKKRILDPSLEEAVGGMKKFAIDFLTSHDVEDLSDELRLNSLN